MGILLFDVFLKHVDVSTRTAGGRGSLDVSLSSGGDLHGDLALEKGYSSSETTSGLQEKVSNFPITSRYNCVQGPDRA